MYICRSLSRSGLRSGYNTPKKGVSVWGDSDGGTSQDGSIAYVCVSCTEVMLYLIFMIGVFAA